MRRRYRSWGEASNRLNHLNRLEKLLIRVMILASLAVVLAQIGRARNPLDLYFAMAAKVENPPLTVPASALAGGVPPQQPVQQPAQQPAGQPTVQSDQQPGQQPGREEYQLVLRAEPPAVVRVWQNGRLIGDLSRGTLNTQVLKGEVLLDGRAVKGPVRVQVVQEDSRLRQPPLNRAYLIDGNVQTLPVSP